MKSPVNTASTVCLYGGQMPLVLDASKQLGVQYDFVFVEEQQGK